MASLRALWSLGLLLAFSCLASAQPSLPGWQLIWQDEFNGNSLNTSLWDVEVNCWGGGNNEKQCYVNSPNNLQVKDGVLSIRAIAGSLQGCTLNTDNSCTRTMPSTSGRIRTMKPGGVGSWKYGRFEMRAQLPIGNFLWPAFWMLPTDNVYGSWAASGEIDIMEFRGQDKNKVLHTLHYGGGWPNNQYGGVTKTYGDLTADYHVYALEWTNNEMKWFVDNTLSHTQNLNKSWGSMYRQNGQPWDQKFHLILNLAVGGNFFGSNYGPFNINSASASWRQPYMIDYVRVYQQAAPVTPTPAASPVAIPVAPVATPVAPEDCPATTTPPSIVDLVASSDTYIHGGPAEVNQNFGNEKQLQVKTATYTSRKRISFVEFDLSRVNATVTKATLKLFGYFDSSADPGVTVFVHDTSVTAVKENDLTWNNVLRGIMNGSPIGSIPVTSDDKWYSLDVTSVIKSRVNGKKGAVSFGLQTTDMSRPAVFFHSREHGKNKPTLSVQF